MDEILIEEKKYISSKRAAKITGYAKDYIGQLCREGRVPARLVGRSWYVLETAIQDHRFGDQEMEPKKTVGEKSKPIFTSTWEAPRYEAVSEDILPSVNRLREESSNIQDSIQDSWREWFDRMEPVPVVENAIVAAGGDPEQGEGRDPESDKREEPKEPEEEPEEIPIHAIYKPFPTELLPHRPIVQERDEGGEPQEKKSAHRDERRGNRAFIMTVQTAGVLLAIIIAATAVVGSGYLDKYILSSSPVSIIAGVSLYNR